MEFGKIDEKELDAMTFVIPPDPASTKATFKNTKRPKGQKPVVKLGGAKWGRKDWIGKIYPKGTKEKDFLECYARMFETIEMNSLFYNIQPREVIESWVSKVGKGFTFCPKFYQGITHMKQFNNTEELTGVFLKSISAFGQHLGPSFIQLSDRFAPNRFEKLEAYLRTLPNDLDVFVEVRHKDWFMPEHTERLFELLQELGVGWAITDTTGRRDCMHMQFPMPKAFIRFVGNNLHPSDYSRIDEWAERIKKWMKDGAHSVHFFLHQHDELYAPELMTYTATKFNEVCGLDLPVPSLELASGREGKLF